MYEVQLSGDMSNQLRLSENERAGMCICVCIYNMYVSYYGHLK